MGVLFILQASLLFLATALSAAAAPPETRPGCQAACGDITIPYPFGLSDGCYRPGFDITCNTTFSPPKPFLSTGNIDVLDISSNSGLLRISQFVAKDCYFGPGTGNYRTRTSINLSNLPYKFSNTRNKFVAMGCDTLGYIIDESDTFRIGCASVCNNISYVQNGSCSGIGCCETNIPIGVKGFYLELNSFNNHSNCWEFSPCSYAFLADLDSFKFSVSNFTDLMDVTAAPVTLEWSVGNKTCEEVRSSAGGEEEFACVAENSYCYDAGNVLGYRCNCSQGYRGNPYLTGGCQDINECEDKSTPCTWNCINVPGNYTCICPPNMEGDGRKDGTGCNCRPGMQLETTDLGCKAIPNFPVVIVVIGIVAGLVFLIGNIFWSYWALKRRKLIKLKEKFFQQNGGLLLQQQISQVEGTTSPMKIFNSEELSKATDNFVEDRIIGKGGFGTVYKGILPDDRVVAVKKSKITDEEQKEQFINEVVILSQINHRNVVRILGCCLETQVPLLIYEFIPNDTLSHHIHDEGRKGSLSFENRLRIAAEIAEALAYLHSSISVPIIHRDVKSTNILLDNNYIAKVSDFGMSRLVSFNQDCLNSLVRGTFGYLDPEYFQSGHFTDKSDVYSFGVVLVELLTGEKPISVNRVPGNGNLASYFISYCNENRFPEILEDRVRDEGQKEKIFAIAQVATRCLCVKREERPTMKEVSKDLDDLMYSNHPWIKKNHDENETFLMKPLLYNPVLLEANRILSEGESSNHPVLPFSMMR